MRMKQIFRNERWNHCLSPFRVDIYEYETKEWRKGTRQRLWKEKKFRSGRRGSGGASFSSSSRPPSDSLISSSITVRDEKRFNPIPQSAYNPSFEGLKASDFAIVAHHQHQQQQQHPISLLSIGEQEEQPSPRVRADSVLLERTVPTTGTMARRSTAPGIRRKSSSSSAKTSRLDNAHSSKRRSSSKNTMTGIANNSRIGRGSDRSVIEIIGENSTPAVMSEHTAADVLCQQSIEIRRPLNIVNDHPNYYRDEKEDRNDLPLVTYQSAKKKHRKATLTTATRTSVMESSSSINGNRTYSNDDDNISKKVRSKRTIGGNSNNQLRHSSSMSLKRKKGIRRNKGKMNPVSLSSSAPEILSTTSDTLEAHMKAV
mmetsp:Transcript_8134/g.11736  ORF Transcript_8134/g.11736 Transcript_8134/m.11736 type:complete len:371 (+) Transcript_8134:29-1141(+)